MYPVALCRSFAVVVPDALELTSSTPPPIVTPAKPESFAVYGSKKYFSDKNRGLILRLSQDGITPISDSGMRSFFRDNLQNANRIYGMYEEQKNKDVVSLNIENRKLEKEERQIWALDIENKRRSSLDFEIFTSFQAMEDYNELKKEEDEIIKINSNNRLSHRD